MRRSIETANVTEVESTGTSESTRIECHVDLNAFFHETLTRACATRRVAVPASTEFYLVGLLAALGHDTAALSRSLIELSFPPESSRREERIAHLRNVGDQALSIAGLFDAHLEHRGISRRYLSDLGSRAYRTAGQLASVSRENADRARAEIFGDLGAHFRSYAQVLEDVREATVLGTPDDVLALYERFCKTRSPALAERLLAHGVVSLKADDADVGQS